MTESLKEKQTIEEFTENLTLEVFIDVMTTANAVNSSYKKVFPNAPNNQTYEEMFNAIKKLSKEPEQEEKK
ncbi:MAG: hypothetical protein ABSA18_12505 [Dehalococcoidia bacterium]